MDHQTEIEKRKYRNWVKGGLAYKYLKHGLEGFADDVVKQDHKRILSAINYTPGTVCTQCSIESLRPIHSRITNYAGNDECPWGQRKCNCLYLKKEKCRFQVCDFIMEEIFKSHGSTPPTPNWANTDIQKWCTEPWEVAKCFINAPGYSDKTKAADIDISGLLHVFINNTSLHSHLACSMAGKNIFIKVLQRRNALFHSSNMEMKEWEMCECIDDIVEILEDPKQLKGRPEVQQAVNKLKQLKQREITTHSEVEVCREALAYVSLESVELEQTIQDAKNFICDEKKDVVERLQQAEDKHKEDVKDVGDQLTDRAKETIQKYLHEAVKEFDKHSEVLYERIKKLEADVSVRVEKVERGACSEPLASLSLKSEELKQTLQDAKNSFTDEMKDIVERLQQEADKHKEYIKDVSHQVTGTAKETIQKSLHEADKHRETLLGRDLCERVTKLETIVFLIMGKQGIVDLPPNEKIVKILERNKGELECKRQKLQRHLDHVKGKQDATKNQAQDEHIIEKSTSSVPLSKDSKLALSSTDEEIRSKDSQEDEILNDSELTKLLLREGRMSQKVFKECKRICKVIKNKSKDIVHVEAAYEFEDDKHVIFLVFAEKNIEIHSIWKTEIRIINSYSNESHVVLYNEENSPLKEKESQQIAEIIDRHSKKLMRDHKFLSAISASSVLSKRFKYDEHKVEKRPCIVLNVLVKGIIPLNEEYFPTELDGIPVDVREGGVRLCVNVAKRFQKNATIGCKITSSKFPEKYGTLGGFIEHPEYGLCGITCAHVFLTALEKFTIKGISTKNVVNENVTIHQPDVSEFQNKLGQLIQITYKEGENDKPGVDLALFKIEKRAPKKGQFPDEQFPEFNDGLVWGKTGIPNGLREVRKFGCVSLETRGVMQCDDSVIRECPFSSYINPGEEIQYTTTLHKQYHIKSCDKDIPFCKQGDSGALVFMEDNTGEETTLRCIGMVVAVSEDNTGYVTPITAILDELKVKQFKPFTTHSTSSTLLEQMRGMFETHSDRFDERFRQLEERISGIETAMNTNN